MELALLVVLRPFIYIALYVGVIYWILRLAWKHIPNGRVKTFLFKRRGCEQAHTGSGWYPTGGPPEKF